MLLLGLSACGNANGDLPKGGKSTEIVEELAPEYSYVAEYFSISENFDFYNPVFQGDNVFAQIDDYDEENGEYRSKLIKAQLRENTLSEKQDFVFFASDRSIDRYCLDEQGNVIVLLQIRPEISEDTVYDELFYENYYKSIRYLLTKYDSQGRNLFEEDVTDYLQGGDYLYISFMETDAKGNCCVMAEGVGAVLFAEDGAFITTLPMQNHIQGMGRAKDGNLYCSSMESDLNKSKCVLRRIDVEQKCFGEALNGFQNLNGNNCVFQKGMDGDILFYDQDAVYEYSLEKQETVKLLTWMDCDIDGSSVNLVSQGKDGRLYVLMYLWNGEGMEIAALHKTRSQELAKRENITLGVILSDSDLSRELVEFNKKSEKYHVSVKTYLDMNDWNENSYQDALERLNSDIVSGNGPDIIALDGLDIGKLVKKGVIEDLTPYLKKSDLIDEKDIFKTLLEGATFDGVLAYIPGRFSLSTLVAKQSLVGDRESWTCKDMMKLAEEYPNAKLLQYADKEQILDLMMRLGKDHFIDSEKMECHFDSEEFKEVLEFANSFPDEMEYSERLVPNLLKDNSLLVTDAYIYDFEEVQTIFAYFDGEPVNFIGYPSYEGGNGCIINITDRYGISAKAADKEGAWSVLEELYLGSMEDTDSYFWGFPASMSKYEEMKKKALEVAYVYEEDGSIMLDENGNPVYENGGSYTMVGDDGEEWKYAYHPIQPEEIGIVEDLLKDAKVENQSMDEEINKIIWEEAQAYFQNYKSVQEVADIIQNRINLFLKENDGRM